MSRQMATFGTVVGLCRNEFAFFVPFFNVPFRVPWMGGSPENVCVKTAIRAVSSRHAPSPPKAQYDSVLGLAWNDPNDTAYPPALDNDIHVIVVVGPEFVRSFWSDKNGVVPC